MGILEGIKKSFGIVHKNLMLLLILFVFNLIGTLIRVPYGQAGVPPPPTSGKDVAMTILFLLIGVLVFGGVLGSIKEFIQTQKVVLSNFIKYGAKFYLRILGVWILLFLVVLAFMLLMALGISLATVVRNLVGVALALAIALIIGSLGIYLFLLLIMSPYILVADDIGPIAAMKRSVSFIRNSLLKIMGVLLLLALISIGIGFIMGIIAGIVAITIKGTVSQVIIGIVASGFNAYINMLVPASLLLVYMSSKKVEESTATPTP